MLTNDLNIKIRRLTVKMHELVDGVMKICYTLLASLGVPVNVVAIVILSGGKCGLSICITRYLIAMATADLLVIVTYVIVWRIISYFFPGAFLFFHASCSVNLVLSRVAIEGSVWYTVTFTFDRFVAICCQILKRKYCTERTATAILSTISILVCLKNIPHYFAVEPGVFINNVPTFRVEKKSYYTEIGWVIFDWFVTASTPLIPFALILILNILTVRYIFVASRVRKQLRGRNKAENHSDPEMESRKKSAILPFTISGNLLLLWLTYLIEFVFYNVTGTDHRDYSDTEYILQQAGYILMNLSCCTNTFIYVVTQSKFRSQFLSMVKYPITSVVQLISKVKKKRICAIGVTMS
ncbi:probable G-protein coupled receptor 139 [Chiloscyllium punctatum]|uniref:probable G-protein coupled receptor 139 n=1 Tax=Chiloscyllium punctatum TaxID=137246 RepID=UPI003B633834